MTEIYALDLDEELLSHLALPDSLKVFREEEVSEELIEDDFVLNVWRWQIDHQREHGKPATASVLVDEFDLDLEDPLTAPGDLVDRLRDRYMTNHAREHMEKLSEAYKEDPYKLVEVMPRVSRELLRVVGPRGEAYGSGDYDRAMDRYDEAVLRGPGPSFGFDEVDTHFHGIRNLVFYIASPKTYKSWMGVNSLVSNVENGQRVELDSLELPADESDMRVRCLAAGVPYWRYIHNALSLEDRDSLREASELLDDMGLYRCVKPAPGHRSIAEMVDRAGENGANLVVVDQLQYVETSNGKQLGAGDHRDYWAVLNEARDLSDHMPLLIIHQFNRTVMFADKMPEMQQAKGAAAIEETATLALGLWANKDMRRSNVVELGTLAARNHTYQSWEVGIELSRGCDFELLGVAMHDDEE